MVAILPALPVRHANLSIEHLPNFFAAASTSTRTGCSFRIPLVFKASSPVDGSRRRQSNILKKIFDFSLAQQYVRVARHSLPASIILRLTFIPICKTFRATNNKKAPIYMYFRNVVLLIVVVVVVVAVDMVSSLAADSYPDLIRRPLSIVIAAFLHHFGKRTISTSISLHCS
jgi:hypothetical protein